MSLDALRERVINSWWFVPALCVLVAVALAVGLIQLDESTGEPSGLAFTGDAAEARQVLSTIASAMLTFTGLVFSTTMVVLTLTSGQFSPRVLRTFLRDRRIQFSLGVFVGTFVFALVALREVRGSGGEVDAFVPGLTVTVAFALVAASVGMFVQYLHHIAQSVRVVTIINRIGKEASAAVDRLYAEGAGADRRDSRPWEQRLTSGPTRPLRATQTGVVTAVRSGKLVAYAARADCVLELVPSVGEFVIEGQPLFRVRGDGQLPDRRVVGCVTIEEERDARQDVAFGFRQLVDIAERALSPGVNDPTTAAQCVDHVHALLYRLASRPFPSGAHVDGEGAVRLLQHTWSWKDYVGLACDEIRHWGAGSLQIHRRLRAMLNDLLTVVDEDRRPPLERQLALLDARMELDLPEFEQEAALARPGPSRPDDSR